MALHGRPTKRLMALIAGLIAGVVVLAVRECSRRPATTEPPPEDQTIPAESLPPDPRLSNSTPFRNVRPDVAYVGDAACAGCHAAIDRSFHAHPMGRSAAWLTESTPRERIDAAARNPVRVGAHELRVERVDGRTLHKVRAAPGELTLPVQLAIGSGTRGRSYLANYAGTVWQSPLSWYARDGGQWDLSPGFDLGEQILRPITAECLACHVHPVEPVRGAINRYHEPLLPLQASIGCEQCHGPGALHVAERAASARPESAVDTSIVNPKHLSPALRSAICEQCHLQGAARVPRAGREPHDFRPGLPYELFATVFVRHPDLADLRRSVGQFEQMEQSRCYLGSQRSLGCTSCHDPHAVPPPEGKAAFYRARCETCHTTAPCTAPPAERRDRADDCIACHMPKSDSSNIVHASVTDHGIPRRPATPARPRGLSPWDVPIVPFRKDAFAALGPEADRAMGIALNALYDNSSPTAQPALASAAVDRLLGTVERSPDDLHGRLALSAALGHCGRAGERFDHADRTARAFSYAAAAQRELTWAAIGIARFDRAESAANDWIQTAPGSIEPHLAQAGILGARADWDGMDRAAVAALRLNPLHPRALLFRAVVRHRRGETAEANADAEAAIGLLASPAAKTAARAWYREMLPR